MRDDARKLAAILIKLDQDYSMFLKDVAPDDPDLDMERGFKCFEKLRERKGRTPNDRHRKT
jgi:hypothetical protein